MKINEASVSLGYKVECHFPKEFQSLLLVTHRGQTVVLGRLLCNRAQAHHSGVEDYQNKSLTRGELFRLQTLSILGLTKVYFGILLRQMLKLLTRKL